MHTDRTFAACFPAVPQLLGRRRVSLSCWTRLLMPILVAHLSACTQMPVSSMLKLRGVAFDRTELSGLRAAVKLPGALRPEPHSVRLSVAVEPGDGTRQQHEFALQAVEPSSSPPLSSVAVRAGERVFVYRIEPAELPKLERFRREMQTRRANATQSPNLHLSVGAKACRETDLPPGPLPMTTYLATPETGSFVALTHDIDLRTLAGGNLEATVPRCPR